MAHKAESLANLSELLEIAGRHKKKLFLYNLIVLTMITGTVLFWPRTYRSEAKIWIRLGRENSKLDPTAATGERISIQESDREDEIKSVIDVIGGRGVATGAVERIGPLVVLGEEPLPGAAPAEEAHPAIETLREAVGTAVETIKQIDPIGKPEEAVQEVTKNLTVDAERKSNVVSMTYEADDPRLAQAIVEALIQQYRADHTRIHRTDGSHKFFEEQRRTLREEVARVSEDLNGAKSSFGLASVDGQRQILESQLLDVQTAKLVAVRRISEAEARSQELTRLSRLHPEHIKSEERRIPNTGRDQLRSQLYTLQMQRMEFESKYRDENPLVQFARKQEEEAERELTKEMTQERTETTQAINQVYQQIVMDLAQTGADVAGNRAMLDQLVEQEKQVLAKISSLNSAEIEINRLQQELRLAEASYVAYAEKHEDARVDEALNKATISNISVAQAPTYEEKPVSPSKLMIALLGIGAMLFGSTAIVAGLRFVDDSVIRPEDLAEVVDAPVIVAVPDEPRYRRFLA